MVLAESSAGGLACCFEQCISCGSQSLGPALVFFSWEAVVENFGRSLLCVCSVCSMALRVGTDCSGLEPIIFALKHLRVPYTNCFACDSDPLVKKQLRANFSPSTWFDNILDRCNGDESTPEVDLYFAGFPCQPFSRAGKEAAFTDPRSQCKRSTCLLAISRARANTF